MAKFKIQATGRFLMLSAFCIVLNGCVGLETYIVSSPISNSSQVDISKKGRFVLDDTVIFVSPTNYVHVNSGALWFSVIPVTEDIPQKDQGFSPGYYIGSFQKPGFFIFEIFFAVGKTPIIFYPGDIVLRHRGKEWRPVNTYELVKMHDATNPFWGHEPFRQLCAGKEQDTHKRHYYHNPIMVTHYDGTTNQLPGIGVPKRIQLEQDTNRCYALKFLVDPPDPREEFDIEFSSLQINNRNVPIRIKYAPLTVKEGHG
ncbi:MAG: hypothetical protein NUV55_09555 [Sulfuricaulis sp.]|uniref:hypothetical protein n=1 Tax=Sulfuricaulis sp. TaxID=2003553 RepID=UPI0025E41152|nr:hypothetical protein [Sulfuricaulis sp.]MCR4347428.1 hypothetical protein [Sulfuricaulis sp.]